MSGQAQAAALARRGIYPAIWRWHFYAGLMILPIMLMLAITGGVYLFKPQIERWEERQFQGLSMQRSLSPQAQLDAALAAYPAAAFHSFRLPDQIGDAAMVHVSGLAADEGMSDIFVAPSGEVLGVIEADDRVMPLISRIHGQLLLGPRGSWIVELAASWAFVLLLSGLYLWWPRGRGLSRLGGGVIWPRLRAGKRIFWRDFHAVTGFWMSGLLLVLLASGLPWANLWGSSFAAVRAEMGWVKGAPSWTIGGVDQGQSPAAAPDPHSEHDHGQMMAAMPKGAGHIGHAAHHHHGAAITLDDIAFKIRTESLAFPVIISPPHVRPQFATGQANSWTVQSMAQNRPERRTIYFDAETGEEVARKNFEDGHIIDRIVGYGVAWHEGALFGWVNQLVGLLTALGLVLMVVSGFILWRRRKPDGLLGAPPAALRGRPLGGALAVLLGLAMLLPMLAISLLVIAAFERLILPRMPRLACWLGAA